MSTGEGAAIIVDSTPSVALTDKKVFRFTIFLTQFSFRCLLLDLFIFYKNDKFELTSLSRYKSQSL